MLKEVGCGGGTPLTGDGAVSSCQVGTSDPSTNPEGGLGCGGCGREIAERWYLRAADRAWHCGCLRCCHCRLPLAAELTCFARDGNIYCKEDYYRLVHILPRSDTSALGWNLSQRVGGETETETEAEAEDCRIDSNSDPRKAKLSVLPYTRLLQVLCFLTFSLFRPLPLPRRCSHGVSAGLQVRHVRETRVILQMLCMNIYSNYFHSTFGSERNTTESWYLYLFLRFSHSTFLKTNPTPNYQDHQ